MRFAPGLYGIADADAYPDPVAAALLLRDAGASVVQVRMKHRSPASIRAALAILAPAFAAGPTVLVLNDHPDLAAEFEGVGAHLGVDDPDPREARALLPDRLIGLSTHDVDQVRAAASFPLDYIGFGPVFSAATKHAHPDDRRAPDPAVGIESLAEAVRASAVPVVAIGGIDRSDRDAVLATGAAGVAVIGAIARADDPSAAAQDWVRACRR